MICCIHDVTRSFIPSASPQSPQTNAITSPLRLTPSPRSTHTCSYTHTRYNHRKPKPSSLLPRLTRRPRSTHTSSYIPSSIHTRYTIQVALHPKAHSKPHPRVTTSTLNIPPTKPSTDKLPPQNIPPIPSATRKRSLPSRTLRPLRAQEENLGVPFRRATRRLPANREGRYVLGRLLCAGKLQ